MLKMLPYKNVATQIKEARERLGYSQREVAERAGVAQTTISYLERGTWKRVDYKILLAVAYALEIPTSILNGDNTSPSVSETFH